MTQPHWIWCGPRRLNVDAPFGRVHWLRTPRTDVRQRPVAEACLRHLRRVGDVWRGRRVAVVIPDATRPYAPQRWLTPVLAALREAGARFDLWVALGLHRPPNRTELRAWLGELADRVSVRMHDPLRTVDLGAYRGVPLRVNAGLPACDRIWTLGVVEPHLYAGFSGGVKGVSIGLGGRETILATHAPAFLGRSGVATGRLRGNPFQAVIRETVRRLGKPVDSLNLVPDEGGDGAFYTLGSHPAAFSRAVAYARRLLTLKPCRPFDILFVGCGAPKDRTLYQASRLFNYVLEGAQPMVRPGGAIVVFAQLGERHLSTAEKNFEARLAQGPGGAVSFVHPGEHRAFKVFEAAARHTLVLVSPRRPAGAGTVLRHAVRLRDLWSWLRRRYGVRARIGCLPSGFAFLASPRGETDH